MIKALLLDIDNTLLDATGKLSCATKEALALAQANNLQIILATARGYRSTRAIHKELRLTTPVVCHMGAMVYDYQQEKPLQTWPLPTELAQELATLADTRKLRISAYVGDEVWFNQLPPQPLRSDWLLQPNLAMALQDRSTLEMVVVGAAAVQEMMQAIAQMPWAHEVALGYFEENGKAWLFINRARTSKASALDWLLPQLGVTWQQTAACGDGTADLEMIQRARWGLAAPLAHPTVKEAAHAPFQLEEKEPIASLVQEILARRGNMF